MAGDQRAPSWAVGTLAKPPAKDPRTRLWCCWWRDVSSKGATADSGVMQVDPVPPATPADIEDLSFWLADQFLSHAFEVFFCNLCFLCRSDPNIDLNNPARFKKENTDMVKEMVTDSFKNTLQLPDRLHAEKSRMRNIWFRHQDAKQSTMVAHLNFLFKSDKFEACNVNHLYQVSASFTQKLASLPPSIQPLSPPLVYTL